MCPNPGRLICGGRPGAAGSYWKISSVGPSRRDRRRRCAPWSAVPAFSVVRVIWPGQLALF